MVTFILFLSTVFFSLAAMEQQPLTSYPVSKIDRLLSFCHAHMNGLLTRHDQTLEFQHILNTKLKEPIVIKIPFKRAYKYYSKAKDRTERQLNNALHVHIINKYIEFKNNTDLPDSLIDLKGSIAVLTELVNALATHSKDEKYDFDRFTKSEQDYLATLYRAEKEQLELLRSIIVKEYDDNETVNFKLGLIFSEPTQTRTNIAESFKNNDIQLFDQNCNQTISLQQTLKKYQKEE